MHAASQLRPSVPDSKLERASTGKMREDRAAEAGVGWAAILWASLPALVGLLVVAGVASMDVGAVAGAVWAAVALAAHRRRSSSKAAGGHLPPGPMGLPVIGHLHLVGTLPHQAFYEMSKRYGPVLFVRLGSAAPTVVVSTADAAREVLHDLDEACADRPRLEFGDRLFYRNRGSMLVDHNAMWRSTRRLYASELLSARSMQLCKSVRDEEMAVMLDGIQQKAGQPISVYDAMSQFTLNVLMRIMFSERADDRLAGLAEMVLETASLFVLPIIGELIPAIHWFDPFQARKKLDSVHARLDSIIESLIRARIELPPALRPKDMLTTMLHSTDDILLVKAMILEMFLAGTETTSSTLEAAWAELMRAPHILQRLREELDSKIGTKRQIEDEDIGSLEYLQAVIKETWRLHPPVPLLIPHYTKKELTLAGYRVPAHTRVMVNAWAVGRDEGAWVERVHEFWPDRFMGPHGPSKDVTHSSASFELLPFGRGRRACPGSLLATSFSHVALANLIHRFDWTLPPSFTVSMEERPASSFALVKPILSIPTPIAG